MSAVMNRKMARVVVVGSINQDITVVVPRFPAPGETLHASSLAYRLGGKGANQAAAAARAGAETFFIGAVGDDEAGQRVYRSLAAFGVDVTSLSVRNETATGTAHVTVTASGENTVVVAHGANATLMIDDVDERIIASAQAVVLQAEVPLETNLAVIDMAGKHGIPVFLNLAPASDFPREYYAKLDTLIVNETETGIILDSAPPVDINEAHDCATALLELGCERVVITLGAAGAVIADEYMNLHVPGIKAERVVDTTGAGDATVGVLAANLARGIDFEQSTKLAMRAGALTVTREGAADSYGDFNFAE